MTTRSFVVVLASGLGLLGNGCAPDIVEHDGLSLGSGAGPETAGEEDSGGEPLLPPDDRPIYVAQRPPPAISGGTLIVLADGHTAVAADSDRDRVHVVDLAPVGSPEVLASLELESGSEPGRLVEGAPGRVHVAMRQSGEIVSIAVASGTVRARRRVCPNPRGIVYEDATDLLHVACKGGDLVTLRESDLEETRRIELALDLRDVVLGPDGGLYVSRFRNVEILHVDANGFVVGTRALDHVDGPPTEPCSSRPRPFDANTAWRMVSDRAGGWIVLHQAADTEEIDLDAGPRSESEGPSSTDSYGGSRRECRSDCGGIVHAVVTHVKADGSLERSGLLSTSTLAVDLALSEDGVNLALAIAGHQGPYPANIYDPQSVAILSMWSEIVAPRPACTQGARHDFGGQIISVAFDAKDRLVAQSRNPPALMVADIFSADPIRVELPGPAAVDTGHDLFHGATRAGLACASCHPEGGDDGRVWRFSTGPRRTQAIYSGLRGTAPYHWEGDMRDLFELFDEVFVRRMGAAPPSQERAEALRDWLFSVDPPRPLRLRGESVVGRGRTLFEQRCQGCHAGENFTNNQNQDYRGGVLGRSYQVPGLRGVAHRGPYMHDGRRPTLREAVEEMLGASAPDGTWSERDVDDLLAFLESL